MKRIEYAIAPLDPSTASRRMREREGVEALLLKIAGPEARLAHDPSGAPRLEGSTLGVSISHSRHFAAVAWSDAPGFGIDIEEPRDEQLRKVASRYLTDDEFARYSAVENGLLQAWTLKEAAYKALRTGSPDFRDYRLPAVPPSEALGGNQGADSSAVITVGDTRLAIVESRMLPGPVFCSVVTLMESV